MPEGYLGDALDVFNAGIILFNLLFGVAPFYDADESDYFYSHLAYDEPYQFWCKQNERSDYRIDLSVMQAQTLSLIESMLSYDPLQRPSVDTIIQLTE